MPVKTALVIGAEKMSTLLDWEDRGTCVLFGDGAGAVVFSVQPVRSRDDEGTFGSDGSLANFFGRPAAGRAIRSVMRCIERQAAVFKMEGREVYKHAVKQMTQST